MDYGFKVVLSSRFADIFRGNSGKAGLLAAQVDQEVIDKLWELVEAEPATEVTVDLEAREVRAGDLVAPINVDDYTRYRLLNGLDDIGITLGNEADITAYEAKRPSWKPVTQHA
jgi:3-isopropylmalate/(R)-2-methylmalate dehydratase small subunit